MDKKKCMMKEVENDANKLFWDVVLNKKESVLYLGRAGSGKSTALLALIEELKKSSSCQLLKFAPTEASARMIGGLELSKFFKVDITKTTPKDCWKWIPAQSQKMRSDVIKRAEVLIIDEIQGVNAQQFKFLDNLCRIHRNRPGAPFGGLKLILVGDPFQIDLQARKNGGRIFDCGLWEDLDGLGDSINYVLTTYNYRFEPYYHRFLEQFKLGKVSKDDWQRVFSSMFKSATRELERGRGDETVQYVRLLDDKSEVSKAREEEKYWGNVVMESHWMFCPEVGVSFVPTVDQQDEFDTEFLRVLKLWPGRRYLLTERSQWNGVTYEPGQCLELEDVKPAKFSQKVLDSTLVCSIPGKSGLIEIVASCISVKWKGCVCGAVKQFRLVQLICYRYKVLR